MFGFFHSALKPATVFNSFHLNGFFNFIFHHQSSFHVIVSVFQLSPQFSELERTVTLKSSFGNVEGSDELEDLPGFLSPFVEAADFHLFLSSWHFVCVKGDALGSRWSEQVIQYSHSQYLAPA